MIFCLVLIAVIFFSSPAQENVMNAHRKSVYFFLWLINVRSSHFPGLANRQGSSDVTIVDVSILFIIFY